MIQRLVLLEIEQFDVATDGDRNDRIADIVGFAGETSAGYAGRDQVGVEVAAVRAFDRSNRIGFAEKDALHLSGFERLKNAMSFAIIA